jgi:hypothetical protein
MRLIGETIPDALPQQVIIDNAPPRPATSGRSSPRAAPDGYTLIMSMVAPMAFSAPLFANAPCDGSRAAE